MSAEAGFLSQLRDHPDDDTTRLVYADWLDEQGDSRAAYLRQELQLAGLPDDAKERAELELWLRQARMGMDRAWLRQAGKRFGVWLASYLAEWKVLTIKLVREATSMGLAEAKAFVESPLPRCVRDNLTLGEAETLRDYFEQESKGPARRDPAVRLLLRRTQAPQPRDPAVALLPDRDFPCEVRLKHIWSQRRQEFAQRLHDCLGISWPEAEMLLQQDLPLTLVRGLDVKQAEALRASFAGLAFIEVRPQW